jgi:flavodoxin
MYRLLFLFLLTAIFPTFANYAVSNEKENPSVDNITTAKTLVVVYSYTGHTRAVANEIMKHFQADIVHIKAKKYDGVGGSIKANKDAWNRVRTAGIKPETVDMSQYHLIFLGAPIWWYRPAVPLWTFVEKNSFKNTSVVLFSTFNSRFKDEYIDAFINLVKKKGGHFLDHIYVRRGRWYSQLNRKELIQKFNNAINLKKEKYKNRISGR